MEWDLVLDSVLYIINLSIYSLQEQGYNYFTSVMHKKLLVSLLGITSIQILIHKLFCLCIIRRIGLPIARLNSPVVYYFVFKQYPRVSHISEVKCVNPRSACVVALVFTPLLCRLHCHSRTGVYSVFLVENNMMR